MCFQQNLSIERFFLFCKLIVDTQMIPFRFPFLIERTLICRFRVNDFKFSFEVLNPTYFLFKNSQLFRMAQGVFC